MMIAAMAKGGTFFEEPHYRRAAEKAAAFLLEELESDDGVLHHAWRNGESKVDAFLDDYAFLMRGLVTLYRESDDVRWLEASVKLAEELELRLRDPDGGYFQTTENPLNLFQSKGALDGAIPSGNGVAIQALLDLGELTGKAEYTERAEAALRAFSAEYTKYPSATKTLALSVARYHSASDPASLADALVTARLEKKGDQFELHLQIREGWHVNANPASSPYLIATEVQGDDVRNIVYPKGELLELSFTDDVIAVYSGAVKLSGESSQDQLVLVYQACDDTRCLSPVEKTLEAQP